MAVPWFCNDLPFFLWFTIGLLGFTIVKLYLQIFTTVLLFFLHLLVGFAIVLLRYSNL